MKICPQCGAEYELDQRFCPKDGTTLRTQGGEADLVGSVVADRYHVMKKLGEGGMGQVYLAEHVKMGRKSALKVMHPKMVQDADAIARFNREASNASRINHPNVAAIYDFGETPEGIIYLAMEFVEGEPLTNIIARAGAGGLAPMRAAEIVRQTAEALNVAHDMGIVHRDLKPDNIMVGRSRDGADLVKVVDFGIAKAADSEGQNVTKTGLIVGTPEYMSPEQIAGDKLDGRSDLYSLALVAFNMLTGKLPFPAASAQESLIMRLTEQPRTLGETRPDVAWPAALQAVMDRALVRDMGHRYAKTTEFARELVRAVEAMPETQVAEGGTLVMSASPAGSPATAVAGAPTSAVPATRIGSLPERPGSHPERSEGPGLGAPDVVALRKPVPKSKTPLIAAMVGSLAVVGAAGYYWVGAGSAASVGDTTQLAGAGAPASVSPAGVPMSQPLSATPALPTSVTMNEVKSLAGSLGTTDTAKTRRILNQLEQLRSVATDSTLDRLDIGIIQAKALLKDVDGACELALRVNTRKLSDVNRERLDVWLGQLNGCK